MIFRWIALISAIVLVVALAGTVVSSRPPTLPTQNQATETNKKDQFDNKRHLSLWDSWFPDSISLYTLFLVIFTAVLALGGVYQLKLLGRAEQIAATTAEAAKKSADIAQDTLVASNRPWISILQPVPDGGLTWEDKGARLTISLAIRNVGKSPAFDIAVEADQFVLGPDNFDIGAAVARHCAEVRRRQIARAASGQHGEVLFPDESLPIRLGLLFGQEQIDAAVKNMGQPFFSPVIVICADYRSPITKQSHTTGLAYLVLKPGQGAGTLPKLPSPNETLNANQFGLVRSPVGSLAD
jgi:hypothetical protein